MNQNNIRTLAGKVVPAKCPISLGTLPLTLVAMTQNKVEHFKQMYLSYNRGAIMSYSAGGKLAYHHGFLNWDAPIQLSQSQY